MEINTKIIVADASIVDPWIIQQHLAETSYEPDKIYFRRIASQQNIAPLSDRNFASSIFLLSSSMPTPILLAP